MKDVLTAPRTAWPSLAVAGVALTTWVTGLVLAGPVGFVLAAIGAYLAFTPMHEATHRSLSRAKWVNEVVGRLASVPLCGPFPVIRDVHLQHHKHTNDPLADPDHWSGRGPTLLLPLRWLTQDIHYYVVYMRRSRPRLERLESTFTLAAVVTVAVVLSVMGHGREVVLYWLLPARVVIGVLACVFDYLPHRPHRITAKQDRMRATSAFRGRWRYIASLGQSLHLVHHLYPGVPFYRYHRVMRALDRAQSIPTRAARTQRRTAGGLGLPQTQLR